MGDGQITTGVRSVLSRPSVYELFQRMIGGHGARTRLVREHLRLPRGVRILDVGCGTGDLLSYLGDVDYVGLDISADYVERARERFAGTTAQFFVGDASAIPVALGQFDVAVATGVLHHLDDPQALAMVAGIASTLRVDGRFVGLEPTFVPHQSRLARAIIEHDRGQHVREPAAYARLASTAFGSVRPSVLGDMLRIPYTHCVLDCRGPESRRAHDPSGVASP